MATATPSFSPVAGVYAFPPIVTISCATAAAIIFYTTDGSIPANTNLVPTGTTQIYVTPLTIALTSTLKANAIAPANSLSATASGQYIQGFFVEGNAGVSRASISDGTLSVTADQDGNFIIGEQSGTVTLTPSLIGYTFAPTSKAVVISGGNVSGVNFVATETSDASAWSPQDCRVAPAGPNQSRNVNGSLIYDVPSKDSRVAGPPQDCRTVVPTDCRTVKPLNSRVAPPFKS